MAREFVNNIMHASSPSVEQSDGAQITMFITN